MRLFVALKLPSDVRSRLTGLMGSVPGARWQTDEQLHLTLRFIGEVSEHKADDIDSALQIARFEPFEVSLCGVGLFGTPRQPRSLWAGIENEAPLLRLNQKIESALVRAGLVPEERKYTPHVTLTRFKGRVSRLDRFLTDCGDLAIPPWTVDQVTLFQSHLARTGAIYQTVAEYPDRLVHDEV